MSKRYRGYRRLTRTYPKQRWQITCVNPEPIRLSATIASNTFYAVHKTICQSVVPTDSAAQSVVSANNIVKTGNFKVKGSFNFSGTDTKYISMIIYVIFVPQGITPDNTAVSTTNLATSIFYSHPEWVMCWTRKDVDESGSDDFSISSRLKRNLNSGDSIQLGVLFLNTTTTNPSNNFYCNINATVQYSARAN